MVKRLNNGVTLPSAADFSHHKWTSLCSAGGESVPAQTGETFKA